MTNLFYYFFSIIAILNSIYFLYVFFVKRTYYSISILQRIFFILSINISFIAFLDLFLTGPFFPNNCYLIHTFISQVNSGLIFLLYLVILIFFLGFLSLSFINKKEDHFPRFIESICVISMPLTFLVISDFIIAGDIYTDLNAEEYSTSFVETVLSDPDYVFENKDRLCTENFNLKITNTLSPMIKHFSEQKIKLGEPEIIASIYYPGHYTSHYTGHLGVPDTAIILFKSKIDSIHLDRYYEKTVNSINVLVEALENSDFKKLHGIFYLKWKNEQYYLYIFRLVKIIHKSRYLGKYTRWAVDHFSYSKTYSPFIKDKAMNMLNSVY